MENIRLIEIPRSKMISSGFGTLEELMKSGFDTRYPNWERTVFPHDFMSYDPERKQMGLFSGLSHKSELLLRLD